MKQETREEQIKQEALNYGRCNPNGYWDEDKFVEDHETPSIDFKAGAEWADKNPNDEVLKLRKMFESDPDAYKQGYNDAIDKACEWIERFAYNSVVTDNIGEREKQAIIIAFKEAMEEQQ